MKVAVLTGTKQISIQDIQKKEVGPGEALIKVEMCGICDTDLHAFQSGKLFPVGTVMGHEVAGIVEKIGKGVEDFKSGDRVAIYGSSPCGHCELCQNGLEFYCMQDMPQTIGHNVDIPGAYAEYIWLPDAAGMLVKIPDELSFEAATLADPVATPLHAIRNSKFKPGDSVIVQGAGPIGLMAIQVLNNSGAEKIIVTEISPQRSDLAIQLGADIVLNPFDNDLTSQVANHCRGFGADVVFECSGVPHAFQQSIQLVRPGGQVMVVGVIEHETPILPLDILLKEIDIKGSLAYTKQEFEIAVEFLSKGKINSEAIISEVIALEDIEEKGFKKLLVSPEIIKILVKP